MADLPIWAESEIRQYEIIEFTGWSIEYVESCSAIKLDRLLTIHRAKQIAKPPREVWWRTS